MTSECCALPEASEHCDILLHTGLSIPDQARVGHIYRLIAEQVTQGPLSSSLHQCLGCIQTKDPGRMENARVSQERRRGPGKQQAMRHLKGMEGSYR